MLKLSKQNLKIKRIKKGKAASTIEINKKRTKKKCAEVDQVFFNYKSFRELLLASLGATEPDEASNSSRKLL